MDEYRELLARGGFTLDHASCRPCRPRASWRQRRQRRPRPTGSRGKTGDSLNWRSPGPQHEVRLRSSILRSQASGNSPSRQRFPGRTGRNRRAGRIGPLGDSPQRLWRTTGAHRRLRRVVEYRAVSSPPCRSAASVESGHLGRGASSPPPRPRRGSDLFGRNIVACLTLARVAIEMQRLESRHVPCPRMIRRRITGQRVTANQLERDRPGTKNARVPSSSAEIATRPRSAANLAFATRFVGEAFGDP